jgi:hypothetical protein
MKKFNLLILFLVSITQYVTGQTVTGTVTQAPCNNDGIYSVTTSGLPLPITYTYYVGTQTYIHANVNSTTDQLTGFGMSSDSYIYCEATSGSLSAFAYDSYTPSFEFTVNGVSPVCPVTMGTVNATFVSGTPGPFNFTWTNTGTSSTYTGNNISVPVGSYSVEIEDQITGCVLEIGDTSIYLQQLSNITATFTETPAGCTNGTATVTASNGVSPYTYLWVNGATTPAITGLSAGYYSVVITDAQGCQSTNLGVYIEQNPQISVNTTVTNATCLQPNGAAMAFGSGGQGPYTYLWSNGQVSQAASNLQGQNYYTVIATDVNGCVGQGGAYINTSTPINVAYTSSASQCTSATGSAALTATGGTAPYTYFWNTNPSTTSTITNVAPGNYSFLVTDAVGCIRTGAVNVAPISSISANVNASTVVCPATTGTVTAVVSGSNGPFTYLWNTGATTNALSGVALGSYSCVITDALGCSVTKSNSLGSVSPVHLGVSTTGTSCLYTADGSATAVPTGGTAPYTYSFSNGSTTPTVSGLGTGGYSVSVTDANGCSKSKVFSIYNANTNQNCYCTISGNVYVDANANCVDDAGENGVENIMIHCSGFGYAFTDANGNYSFKVPTGTYTISEVINQYYPLAPCQSNTNTVSVVAAGGCNTVVNFANVINPLHDLKIVTMNSTVPPIPGNNYQQKVVVMNAGTLTESGIQLGYEHDEQIPFVSASLPGFVQSLNPATPESYGVQSGFPSLVPGDQEVIILNYSTPTTIPLATVVDFFDTVANAAPIATNWLLDNSPWNNVQLFQTAVIGSYDPNYKEVTPRGFGAQGFIPTDTKEFDYTIHFQNEGTYFAQNISVTDQLDADFDWTTFKPGYSDYDYTTTISETGLVTFKFANINLPWKDQYGDALSSALVQYSIKPKTNLPEGTVFTNYADIYFDYNAPITTNTTINTFDDAAAVDESGSAEAVTVDLYPVPVNDNLNIRVNNVSKSGTATVSIIDLTGKVVLSENVNLSEGSTIVTKDLSGLMIGTYLTRIQFENGSSIVKKIILNK